MSYQVTRVVVLSLLLALTSCESDRSEPVAPQASASAVAPGMCAEHGVPEALCTKCNPALANVFKAKGDWCEEHSFPESFCPICHPNAAFPDVGAAPPAHDWCGGHGLPESKCTKCNPSLVSKYKAAGDWCEEHGFPESACPVCNPQSPPGGGAAVVDWCGEHRIPESKCTKCNTELVAQYKKSGDWCHEHGFPESVCPICNPQPVPAGAPGSGSFAAGTKIRFRSPEVEKTAGIETVPARKASVGSGVSCTARIEYNRNRLADIRALVPGVVRKLRADLGQQVKKGAPLFVLESTQVGELQARLPGLEQQVRTARANHERKKELAAEGLLAQRKVEIAQQELASAEAGVASARAGLRLAGAPGGGGGSYVLASPLSGTLVRRPAVVGAYATADTSLGTVANTSTMWALFDIPEASASAVAMGQSVSIIIDGAGDVSHRGKITWIASEVDPKTRMVSARAEIKNEAGTVRANQFARAVIETSTSTEAMMVPRDALQRFGDTTLVFVRISAGLYEPRVVVVGAGLAKEVQVTGDVKPTDAVVTTGAYLLKTELSPESIGAGCCDVEAPKGG
jgi:cobalt-zinc-cadmium efflux system membrane fusion protein